MRKKTIKNIIIRQWAFTRWVWGRRFSVPATVEGKKFKWIWLQQVGFQLPQTPLKCPHHAAYIHWMRKYHLKVPTTSQNFGPEKQKQPLRWLWATKRVDNEQKLCKTCEKCYSRGYCMLNGFLRIYPISLFIQWTGLRCWKWHLRTSQIFPMPETYLLFVSEVQEKVG